MMTKSGTLARRGVLTLGLTGAALALPGCSSKDDKEVGAVEDMMREHGVLRRILVVYRSAVPILRQSPDSLDAGAIADAANLFRDFGEDYHEHKLEEEHVFPEVRKAGGEAAGMIDTLLAQHARGRQITAYIHGQCAGGKVGTGSAEPLARALESFARMYEAHTAYEDTIIFQAWRKALSAHDLDEAGNQFEAIEKEQFKGDGFDIAVDKITEIERRLGLHDLSRFTAPPPA